MWKFSYRKTKWWKRSAQKKRRKKQWKKKKKKKKEDLKVSIAYYRKHLILISMM
jgi:hypothetical protein